MAFGPVGPLAKSVLTNAGYEISRPTRFERSMLRSPFGDWYGNNIALFAEVYQANRETLSTVKEWAKPHDLENSLWRYGVPEQWDTGQQGMGKTGLNEVEIEPTYSDLIAFICRQKANLRYFEIGVSLGKNFLQICENTNGESFVCLDIEKLNPVLEKRLGQNFVEHIVAQEQVVETLSGSPATIIPATYSTEKVIYLRGDQFNPATWAALRGKNFNFIFSDGVHTPEALRTELDFLLSEDLIDTSGPFTMYWDDLVNIEMQTAFDDCAQKLRNLFGAGWHGLHWIHGTYGNKRLNGLFTTLGAGNAEE